MSEIEKYLSQFGPTERKHYQRIKEIVHELVPGEVEETISYGIPTFKYKGKFVIYFAAYKSHMSVHPGPTDDVRLRLEEEGFKMAKGTVQFTDAKPVPEYAIKDIIKKNLKRIV
jgi:uncharacterized protein YdhG (YjbR/CyaY superfamily)